MQTWFDAQLDQKILDFIYSRVWNKRTPLNKCSPLENLAKRISVAPFLPNTYTAEIGSIKSGIWP